MVNKISTEYDNPIDVMLYNIIDSQLDFYYKLGLTPNHLTTISLISGLISVYLAYTNRFLEASILWAIAYYYDCADGKLARKFKLTSKFGDTYDHGADLLKHALMFYVLYNKLNLKSPKVKIIIILLLCIISLLTVSHLGCQEIISKNKDSPTLSYAKYFVFMSDCKKQTKYTKYFSPATISLYIIIVMLLFNHL